jgi:hypothetical protein
MRRLGLPAQQGQQLPRQAGASLLLLLLLLLLRGLPAWQVLLLQG